MTAYLDETGLAKVWEQVNIRALPANVLPKNPGGRNSVARGKDITYKFTDGSLFTDIASGTFDDVFVGDYFAVSCKGVSGTISNSQVVASATAAENRVFYIAHLDKDLHKGDTELTAHHAVVVPATHLGTAPMNATNTTDGGYVGSAMYTKVLPVVKANLQEAFGASHIIKRRAYLSNAQSNGYASGGNWYDSYVELMPENEVYGSRMSSNTNNVAELYNTGTDYGQLALFSLCPHLITTRQPYWLRVVYSTSAFSLVNSNGYAYYTYAPNAAGVRPRFLIG